MIIIAALTRDRVIGKNNAMPWHISEEFRHFRRTTEGHTLIMGRKTFESLGNRPLPGRHTVVVSRSLPETAGVDICKTLEDAVSKARTYNTEIFICGGADIYRQTLPLADSLYLSYVKDCYDGDTHFPAFDLSEWALTHEEDHPDFTFAIYSRKKPD